MSQEASGALLEPDLRDRLEQLRIRIAGRLQRGLYSRSVRYGLRRDLTLHLERPSAKIPIAIRPLVDTDLPFFLSVDASQTDSRERLELAWRRAFIDKGAKGGFVAVDLRTDTPCYMQWLMSPRENEFIGRLKGFPELERDEALLENAYTPVKYRGLGIMSAAMALIAERGADLGARYVLTFVDEQNMASLKGCQRAGFHPHMLHHRLQAAFGVLKWDRFQTLREDDPRRTLRF
jgi:RimJ/RimL family protein N-acetyltransferase